MKSKLERTSVLIILLIVLTGTLLAITNCRKHKNYGKEQVMQDNEKLSAIALKNLSITVVYDNNPFKNGLETAWGFSCVIKGAEKTILFDTGGNGSILLANMKKSGIDPGEIDLVVLSHIHNDHVGGLPDFLEKNPDVDIYMPVSFPAGFKKDISKYNAKIIDVKKPLEISKGIYSTGLLGHQIIEQSLIIITEKGLILITGCAHPGIATIVDKAKELFKKDILLAIGGFHLTRERESEIVKLITYLKKTGVQYIGPTHCSGDVARKLFRKEFDKNYVEVGVGRVIILDELK